eukprot:GSChrysophyteH1.ASY1.ANO1.1317.1 assembled CDS
MSTESPSQSIQKRYGPYEIVKAIGKGKFAIVYRAKRVDDDLVVALKRINVDSIDDKARDKTLKEVGFLQSLDHPNILRKAQERGVGFDERVIWKYFSQICDAIAHMHDRRIMHRDLKPANIFLTLDGTVKVGDLGLSRELSENTIQAHSKVGTPLYMSPEVLKGDGYDFKSDVWSLGCILYELAMLKSPFKAEGLNLYSLFQKISNGDFQPLPENYSEDLRNLSYLMISTKPEDRPEMPYSCDVSRRMRVLFSDKNAAAKRLKEQQQAAAAAKEEGNVTNQQVHERENQQDHVDAEVKPQAKSGAVDSGTSDAKALERNEQAIQNRRGDSADAKESLSAAQRRGQDDKVGPQNQTAMASDDWATRQAQTYRDEHDEVDRQLAGKYMTPSKEKDAMQPMSLGKESFGLTETPTRYEDSVGGTYSGKKSKLAAGDSDSEEGAGAIAPAPLSHKGDSPGPGGHRAPAPQAVTKSSSRLSSGGLDYDKLPTFHDEEAPANKRNSPATTQVTRRIKPQGPSGASSGRSSKSIPLRGSSTSAGPVSLGHDDNNTESGAKLDGVAFGIMDALYARLEILGYPMSGEDSRGNRRQPHGKGRLLPIHFACDLAVLGSVAGYGQERHFFQFRRMVDVACWLCRRAGGRAEQLVATIEVDHDAPVTVAKQVLIAAEALGSSKDLLQDVTPTSLSTGYGANVCSLLLAMAEASQREYPVKQGPVTYPDDAVDGTELDGPEDNAEGRGSDDEDEIAETSMDALQEDMSVHDDTENKIPSDELSGSFAPASPSARAHIQSNIDPIVWREETERVAGALSRASTVKDGSFGGGWTDRLSSLQTYFSGFNGDANAKSSASKKPSFAEISATLTGLSRLLVNEIENIRRSEYSISVRNIVSELSAEFSVSQKEAKGLEEAVSERSSRISSMGDQLAAVEEKLEEAVEKFESRSGGTADQASGSVRYRAAIKKIKDDCCQMSLNIGFMEALLMSKHAAHAKRSHAERHRKKNDKKKSYNREENYYDVLDI